jgi:hypothetical protein
VYDPATNTWSAETSMPTARWGVESAVVDGKLIGVGGADASSTLLNVVEAFTPAPSTPPVQHVGIDIKPGGDPNSLNLASNGMIAVAIYTTTDFDASQVDVSTVVFAGASAAHSALEDVDHDGDLDLVLHFRTQDTNLRDIYADLVAEDINEDGVLDSNHKTAQLSLTGQTTNDAAFEGLDNLDLFLSGKALRSFLADLAASGAI